MGGQTDTAERIIARIARRQHGVVARVQLLAAGVSSDEIQKRLDKGSLIRVHLGVYRVGHAAPSVEATRARPQPRTPGRELRAVLVPV